MVLLVASALVLAALLVYWSGVGIRRSGRYCARHLVVLPALLLTLALLQQSAGGLRGGSAPVFVAIAADVSLSMGTMPAPLEHAGVGTRLQRTRRVLLSLLAELESSARPVMVGVTAFTSKAETILAWDDNLPQVREAVEYVLTPGLLTESGSDLGAALEGAERIFELLPVAYRESNGGKFLVLVSDGEQNVESADIATAIRKLREQGVKIVSLHVGLADVPEGLPVYGAAGTFTGFDPVGGRFFSVPDPSVMRALAGSTPEEGIFVKAEDRDAAEDVLEYMGIQIAGSQSDSVRMALLLALWCLTMAALLRHV